MHGHADAGATDDAEHTAGGGEEDRLHQELPQHFGASCAQRLADADLTRALRHRNGHDAHDADATHHQGDRRDNHQREERRGADLIPQFQNGVGCHQVEVVGFVEAESVPIAHDLLDLTHGDLAGDPLARHGRNQDAAHFAAAHLLRTNAELLLIGRLRDDHEVVHAEVKTSGTGAFVCDTHNLVFHNADTDGLADGILVGEEGLNGRLSKHHDIPATFDFAVREKASFRQRHTDHIGPPLGGAQHADHLGAQIPVVHPLLRRGATIAQHHVNNGDRGRFASNRFGVIGRHVRAHEQRLEIVAGRHAEPGELGDGDRVGTKRGNRISEGLVEATNERRHPDNRRDADDDAEHRQARSHLVGPQCIHGHHEDFVEQSPAHVVIPSEELRWGQARRRAWPGRDQTSGPPRR